MFVKVISVLSLLTAVLSLEDKPCLARRIPGQSVVCVCNTTYCDELVREIPTGSRFITYTSSEAGSRFAKATGNLRYIDKREPSATILELDLGSKYQLVEGFGGAVSDSAAINWMNLTDPRLKQNVIDSYFSNSGLRYNMIRVPIGGTDFSTHPYAYNELPEGDVSLANFTLAYEDFNYKIPMIKEIMKTAVEPVHVIASTWSPPLWMKTDHQYGHKSELKEEYYQTYADYHIKFMQQYASYGIPVWGITTTNEPLNGVIDFVAFNSLGWSPLKQGKWIAENLGPTVRRSSFSDVKILALDDQRGTLPWWFNGLLSHVPNALQYIDGVALHYYNDDFIPVDILSLVYDKYPDKFLIATEACEGPGDKNGQFVLLGSWNRAVNYITHIMEDLNHNVVGWLDWNLCLNLQGGPNWVKNFVDSPVIVFPENKEFVKQPLYYALGHFSKFLPRGSQRIKVTQKFSPRPSLVQNVAFLTPENTVIVVLYNEGDATNVSLRLGWKKALVPMEARSVVTVEIPYK